jgi:hypothetical protein
LTFGQLNLLRKLNSPDGELQEANLIRLKQKIRCDTSRDRHKAVFSPKVRVVSKCALKKQAEIKISLLFIFSRFNEDVRFAH